MSLTGDVAGVVSGLLSKGGPGAPDLSALFQTIANAGAQEKDLINALPDKLKPLYADYKASLAQSGTNLQTGTKAITDRLTAELPAIYDPNAPAVQASLDAAKKSIYANVPGQQNAIRQALAATGGFDRGTASKQLVAPVLQAGQQYGQTVANVTAEQLNKQQTAKQQALTTVTNLDEGVVQSLFGMSKEEAQQILTSGRQDLQEQLTQLINQINTQTNQTLGLQGAQVQNQYNADVANTAKKNAQLNAWVNLGADAASSIPGFISGLGATGAPAGYNPGGSYEATSGAIANNMGYAS